MAHKKTVIFVCEHGSAKSIVAAAYFNKLAQEKNLPVQALPEAQIQILVCQVMRSPACYKMDRHPPS